MGMFGSLSERLNHIFSKLTKRGKLTELEIKQAMREVRVALLEADVNFVVAKDFINKVSEKAVGELSYEIDTEVTNLLVDNAAKDAELTWSKTLPIGVSKSEHYEGFTEILEIARQKIYDRTKKLIELW